MNFRRQQDKRYPELRRIDDETARARVEAAMAFSPAFERRPGLRLFQSEAPIVVLALVFLLLGLYLSTLPAIWRASFFLLLLYLTAVIRWAGAPRRRRRLWIAMSREGYPTCARCGYDLSGIDPTHPPEICPECGRETDAAPEDDISGSKLTSLPGIDFKLTRRQVATLSALIRNQPSVYPSLTARGPLIILTGIVVISLGVGWTFRAAGAADWITGLASLIAFLLAVLCWCMSYERTMFRDRRRALLQLDIPVCFECGHDLRQQPQSQRTCNNCGWPYEEELLAWKATRSE